MLYDNYLALHKDIRSSAPNEAIAATPLFAELCKEMPMKVAALCIESPNINRTDLLAAMELNASQCEELLLWFVMQLTRIEEHNRACLLVLFRGASPAFLRERHAQLQGKTIGGMLAAKSAMWALDMLGEVGVNPFYDEGGNLCLYEFLALDVVPIVFTLRYGVEKGFIQAQKDDVLYHLMLVNAQSKSFDVLTIAHELETLGFAIPASRQEQLFSRILQSRHLAETSPIAHMLVCQKMAQRNPALLDTRFSGEGVLGRSSTVDTAYATYACMERVWDESSMWAKTYIESHGPELLQSLAAHSYQDCLMLIERALARPGAVDNAPAKAMLEKALLSGRPLHAVNSCTGSGPNDWIALYEQRAQGFEFTPIELALVHCTLATLSREAGAMHVAEHMWPHALYRLAEISLTEKHYQSDIATQNAAYKKLVLERSYNSILEEEKHPAAVKSVLSKMDAFLKSRPPRMQGTAFFSALSEWLLNQPDHLGCLAFYLQKRLVLGSSSDALEPVAYQAKPSSKENDLLQAIEAAKELVDKSLPVEVPLPKLQARLYTEQALQSYTSYVSENKDRKKNVEFLKRLGTGEDNKKTLARSMGALEQLQTLRVTFQHFGAVIDHVENHLYLCNKGDGAFYIPPVLLVGGPGIGKTFFLHELARIVSTRFEMIGLEGMTSGFDITGLTEGYSTGGPGRLLLTLLESPQLNPIVLLDEIDKAGGDSRYGVVNRLLPLLERYTAQKFKDECLPLEVDASKIVWFSTANDASVLSGPIKSRFDIFEIAPPNAEQKNALTQGVYQRLLSTNAWGVHLDERLSQDVLDVLSTATTPGAARDVRRILTSACAQAIRHESRTVEVPHLGLALAPVFPWNAPARNTAQQQFLLN